MNQAKFSIGIDLGTSNSVLAYCELSGIQKTQVLEIPQYDTPTTVKQAQTLPSFLYLPEDAVATALGAQGLGPDDWTWAPSRYGAPAKPRDVWSTAPNPGSVIPPPIAPRRSYRGGRRR